MQRLLPFIAAATLAVISGCARPEVGVVRDLPPPLFGMVSRPSLRASPVTRVVPVAPQWSTPQPLQPPPTNAEWGWIPPGGIQRKWQYIVIHHSAGDSGGAAAFDRYHRESRGWDELGYHFVVGNGTDTRDGQIEVGARWTKQKHGAHCKTPDNFYNDHGIGICLVGDFDRSGPSTSQMAALAKLLDFLMDQCRIPLDRVVTHGGVTGHTVCPGRRFPLGDLKRRLTGADPRSDLY